MVTVADVVHAMEAAYPPHLAESWDAVGLICGDPEEPADRVMLALDCTDEVVDYVIDAEVDMLIVHHPLLLRGVTEVPADSPKGRIIHKLIRNKIALFAAHTNADSARPGVNDRLAELLGVAPGAPLRPIEEALDKWGVAVPTGAAEQVKQAIFAVGAGAVGNYREVAYQYPVSGQFRPVEGANPNIGSAPDAEGHSPLEKVDEVRVEFIAPRRLRSVVKMAVQASHPYEEPAFDVVETHSGPADLGIGRVGELDSPMTLREFTQRVSERLPRTSWGVRAAGDPERMVHKVAVASGAGDSFLDQVAAMDVDCFVTSDLRHHPVDEHLRKGGCPVIDTAHWASEFPWCQQAADIVAEATGATTEVVQLRTDPWTIHEKGEY